MFGARIRQVACGLVVLLVGVSMLPAQTAPSLVTGKIDDRSLVALPGHVHPQVIGRFDGGQVSASMPLPHMVLVLKRSPEQEQALGTLLDQLHDAKSPMYHRWLTPEEFGQFFGPSDQDMHALTGWLEGNGFKVDEVSPGRTTIVFSGTSAQVERAFHTQIHSYDVNGETHFANSSNPQIPAALSSLVAGFRSLNNFEAKPLHHIVGGFTKDKSTGEWKQSSTVAPNLTSLAGPVGDARLVGPQDFYTIYNLNPLLKAGINGAGQTIAVIEQSDVNPADVKAFRSQFGLPAYPATPNATQGGVRYFKGVSGYCADPGVVASGDEDEAILDVEWAGAVAPNATIDVVSCASSGSSQGTDLALTYIVNHLSSSVSAMSYSYGACEAALGGASNAFYKNTYQQAVAQGQTVVVSTGDGGSPGCDNFSGSTPNPATQGLAVNGLASTPYNIAAGGTDFSDVYQNLTSSYWDTANGAGYSSAKSYIPETAWNGSCASPVLRSYAAELGLNPGATPEAWCNNASFKAKYGSFVFLDGSSGGSSSLYAKPSWQSAYGVPNDAKRDLPDISLFASNFVYSHAMAVCQSDRGYACDMSNSTAAQTMAGGGTSFVAPEVAGLIALVNQKTNSWQGQANYTLYALAASEYGSPAKANTATLNSCNGSQKGSAVGSSCMFYDVNAAPNPAGGTIKDTISQPCAAGSPNCVATAKKDAYGLLSSSTLGQVAAYPVGTGYDLATGLGSINFANLVNNWVSGSSSGSSSFKTSTTLVASPTTIPLGGVTNLTATVTNSTFASPAGVVNFYAGSASGRLLGTATLLAGKSPTASATLQVPATALDPGANNLVAVFPGDGANDAASASTPVNVNVGLSANVKTTPTISLASSASSVFVATYPAAKVSQSVTLTASTTHSGSTALSGSVQFFSGTISLGTSTISGGVATLAVDSSLLTLGTNSLTATYLGDGNYNAVTSGAISVSALNNTISFGSVNVGSTSPTQQFTVTFLAATTVGAISDLTLGTTNQDYLDGGSSSCKAKSYAANATCVASLAYKPALPGTRLGSVVFYDGNNVPVFTLPATGVGTAPLLSFGFAAPTYTQSSFDGPAAVTVDPSGNMYVADIILNRIVEVTPSESSANLGTGLLYPDGLAMDGSGNLYVSDANFGVSKIPFENGALNSAHQTALSITGGVQLPAEIAFDSAGNMYIADTMNNRVLKLTQVNGALNLASPTVIGSGFTSPEGVAVDAAGNVYVADTGFPADPANGVYGRIVKVAAGTGVQTTLNISVAGLSVNSPCSIAINAAGEIFISDANNTRVLKLSPDTSSQSALNLSINAANPQYFGGLALDLSGNLWVPDFLNNQIVKLAPKTPTVKLYSTMGNASTAGPASLPVSNIGNAPLQIYGFTPPTHVTQQGGTCLVNTTVAPGSSCSLSVVNDTSVVWSTTLSSFGISDNGLNVTTSPYHQDSFKFTGGAEGGVLTDVTLTASVAQESYPQYPTFYIAVQQTNTWVPTGSIILYDGETVVATLTLGGDGKTNVTPNPLSAGTHSLTAVYSGDSHYAAGTSNILSMPVSQAAVTLSASCWNGTPYGVDATCQIIVGAINVGNVSIGAVTYVLDGGTPVAVPVTGGSAEFVIPKPLAGSHTIVFSYSGNENYAAAVSQTVTFVVQKAPTQIQLTPSSYYLAAGTPLTLSVSLTSWSAGAPSGIVTFFDGTTQIGTATIASGAASLTTTTLGVGQHNLTASFAGDSNFAAVVSSGASVTIH
jgi:Pro-kumamolisin, activation domain/Bacterial Ig-like domain (group 3)